MGCCGSKPTESQEETRPLLETVEPKGISIVQSTAEKLIDITSAKMIDQLQQEQLQQRTIRNNEFIKSIPISRDLFAGFHFKSHQTGAVGITKQDISIVQEFDYQPEKVTFTVDKNKLNIN
jgi:hypothetical protein